MQRPIFELIEELILDNYTELHIALRDITSGDATYHALLTGVAMGDGRVHSALKRSGITEEDAEPVIAHLCQLGMLELKAANAKSRKWMDEHPVSDKLMFTMPFMRFWFAFVSPLFKGVREGNYDEVRERYENRRQEIIELVFNQLSLELLKKSFEDDPLVEAESYWDADVEIDMLAKSASGKIIAGSCKYSSAKMKKNELTRLKESCALIGVEPDICVLISKQGFSTELRSLKGEKLRLMSLKHFKKLLETIEPKELMSGFIAF